MRRKNRSRCLLRFANKMAMNMNKMAIKKNKKFRTTLKNFSPMAMIMIREKTGICTSQSRKTSCRSQVLTRPLLLRFSRMKLWRQRKRVRKSFARRSCRPALSTRLEKCTATNLNHKLVLLAIKSLNKHSRSIRTNMRSSLT